MSDQNPSIFAPGRVMLAVGARCVLGAALIYFGLVKAVYPVDFLKVLREYELTGNQMLLNSVAALLPWLEMLCGVFLVCGVAVRGSAVVTGVLLVLFTIVVSVRALAIYKAGALPFCAIKFDCGCGSGEVKICRKLLENGALILLSVLACNDAAKRICFQYQLFPFRGRATAKMTENS
jgi:uncharacterized membrane protein YphA (DoxX/SURF4 family)